MHNVPDQDRSVWGPAGEGWKCGAKYSYKHILQLKDEKWAPDFGSNNFLASFRYTTLFYPKYLENVKKGSPDPASNNFPSPKVPGQSIMR